MTEEEANKGYTIQMAMAIKSTTLSCKNLLMGLTDIDKLTSDEISRLYANVIECFLTTCTLMEEQGLDLSELYEFPDKLRVQVEQVYMECNKEDGEEVVNGQGIHRLVTELLTTLRKKHRRFVAMQEKTDPMSAIGSPSSGVMATMERTNAKSCSLPPGQADEIPKRDSKLNVAGATSGTSLASTEPPAHTPSHGSIFHIPRCEDSSKLPQPDDSMVYQPPPRPVALAHTKPESPRTLDAPRAISPYQLSDSGNATPLNGNSDQSVGHVPVTSGSIHSGKNCPTCKLFLQLGRQTKRATIPLSTSLSLQSIRDLFLEKYPEIQLQPAGAKVYIKDGAVWFELEDITDVKEGTLLKWVLADGMGAGRGRARFSVDDRGRRCTQAMVENDGHFPLVRSQSVVHGLEDNNWNSTQVPQMVDARKLSEEISDLKRTVATLANTQHSFPATHYTASLPRSIGSPDSRPSSTSRRPSLQYVPRPCGPTASAWNLAPLNPPPRSTLPPVPNQQNSSVDVTQAKWEGRAQEQEQILALKKDVEALQNERDDLLRTISNQKQVLQARLDEVHMTKRELASLDRSHREFQTQARDKLFKLSESMSNIGKGQLDQVKPKVEKYERELESRLEDLKGLIEETRTDVTTRGSIPTNEKLSFITNEAESLRAIIDEAFNVLLEKEKLKKGWEESLARIVREQKYVQEKEDAFDEADEKIEVVMDTIDKLKRLTEIVKNKSTSGVLRRGSKGQTPPLCVKTFSLNNGDSSSLAPEEISACVVEELRTLTPTPSGSRMRSIIQTEKVREWKIIQHKRSGNRLQKDLDDFAGLRQVGGHVRADNDREKRDRELWKKLFEITGTGTCTGSATGDAATTATTASASSATTTLASSKGLNHADMRSSMSSVCSFDESMVGENEDLSKHTHSRHDPPLASPTNLTRPKSVTEGSRTCGESRLTGVQGRASRIPHPHAQSVDAKRAPKSNGRISPAGRYHHRDGKSVTSTAPNALQRSSSATLYGPQKSSPPTQRSHIPMLQRNSSASPARHARTLAQGAANSASSLPISAPNSHSSVPRKKFQVVFTSGIR